MELTEKEKAIIEEGLVFFEVGIKSNKPNVTVDSEIAKRINVEEVFDKEDRKAIKRMVDKIVISLLISRGMVN